MATNLTHFLPSIASTLKTKPLTPYFFKTPLHYPWKKKRKIMKKLCGVDFASMKNKLEISILEEFHATIFFTILHMPSAFAAE